MSAKSMLLMSGSRLHGFEYLEHAKELITNFLKEKNVKSILFVPYALKDYDKYTNLMRSTLEPWGFQVEGLHTKNDPIEAVKEAETIFVGGGNTFVLLKTLYDKNLISAIREQVGNGTPYIGSSAGTNVATSSIHTTNDMPILYPPTFEALGLVPFNINPHYLETDPTTKHKGETRDERLNEFLEYHRKPILGLREGTSVLVKGARATLMGSHNAKLFIPDKDPIEYKPNDDLSFLLTQ